MKYEYINEESDSSSTLSQVHGNSSFFMWMEVLMSSSHGWLTGWMIL